jgi:hypothetical protein
MDTNDDQVVKEDSERMDLDLPADMFRSGEEVEETTIQMQHRPPGFLNPVIVNVDVNYTPVEDQAIFEGDIVLGDLETIRSAPDARGIGIAGEQFRWPCGLIPYVTQERISDRVEAAIAHWEKHTPIRFKLHENEKDLISFEFRFGCSSRVGRHGGMQIISLGPGCSVGSAIHEIGHALGLWHEQSRSDRDEFIEIITENIQPKALLNFDKHIQDGRDLGQYDFTSIMHYPATAFGIDGRVTIRTKQGEPIGQRIGLSYGDIASIKLLYPDLNWAEEETGTEMGTEL